MNEAFDVIAYFQDTGVPYFTSGKNVSEGWVNIQCIFCHDHSNHLGINLDNKGYHCWICGSRGWIENIIMEIEHVPMYKAKEIIEKYKDYSILTNLNYKHNIETKERKIKLPPFVSNEIKGIYRKYLQSRGFNQDHIDLYKLMAVGEDVNYDYRILIPIFQDGEMVAFTARDVTGKSKVRYKQSLVKNSIIPAKDCVFGIDMVRDKLIICEGPFDAMKLGRGAVSLMGIEYTNRQLDLLIAHEYTKAFIMFDPEEQAQKNAAKLARELSLAGKQVEILTLDKGDPADLTMAEAAQVKSDLGFRGFLP